MSDFDTNGRVSRTAIYKVDKRDVAGFDAVSPPSTGMPDGNETLAWLAGNRMPERGIGLQAPAGRASRRAEAALQMVRPTNPVEAARKRASILADLNRDAPNDPRVQSVFDADPIVAEDPTNGNLVTRQMLNARLDLFDEVLGLIGRGSLPRVARSRLAITLKTAYTMLDNDAQIEWALSEVRLEEAKALMIARSAHDLDVLRQQLAQQFEREGIWAAARTFSIAAHLSVGELRGSAALADLLAIGEVEG